MEKRQKTNLNRPQQKGFGTEETKDLIFGTRAIIEAIKAGKEIDKLFVQKSLANELITELLGTAHQHQVPITKVPIEKLNKITRKNHQGAIAFLSAINYASLDNVISECFSKGKAPLFIMLDRITDVRNFGAVARTAECAGVDAIIIPEKGNAAISSDAMKTSAGALNYIPVCREKSIKSTVNYLKNHGIQVIACTEKTDKLLYSVDYTIPTAIVLGSEEDGISQEILTVCDKRAKIPMTGNIESLNVSVAAAIMIYEGIRQRNS
jgi:23S rRNA (guanosine2251-2'-O)-methyltransferase